MYTIRLQDVVHARDNGKVRIDMQANTVSSPMTDRELAEIEFFASVGVFSEDYVTRLVAEVRRLQEEVASVSGIDMLVAADHATDTQVDEKKNRVSNPTLSRTDEKGR